MIMGGAPKGNQNGVKLKDPKIRKRAYKAYCAWIADGKVKESFTFEEGDLKCVFKTIESYMEKDPVEFPPIHREFAQAKGYAHWEDIVGKSAQGKNKEANTASLQMVMRNKYGWDKPDPNKEHINVEKLEALVSFFTRITPSQAKSPESIQEEHKDRSALQDQTSHDQEASQ